MAKRFKPRFGMFLTKRLLHLFYGWALVLGGSFLIYVGLGFRSTLFELWPIIFLAAGLLELRKVSRQSEDKI